MNPPTISFTSTKGPSVTPDEASTLPPGLSLPPMSRMFALNLSFQTLNAAYISCICAGEGCGFPCCDCGFPGALRWMHMYFWVGIIVSCRRRHGHLAASLMTREGWLVGHFNARFLENLQWTRWKPLRR